MANNLVKGLSMRKKLQNGKGYAESLSLQWNSNSCFVSCRPILLTPIYGCSIQKKIYKFLKSNATGSVSQA